VTVIALLHTAVVALLRNALRSFLAALGIIIAVAAVVSVVAIGDGARAKVAAQMSTMGANLLVVLPGAIRARGVSTGSGAAQTLTFDDAISIERELAGSVAAAAPINRASAQVIFRDANWSTNIQGSTLSFFAVRNWPLAAGDFWTREDEGGATKVCVIGKTVADRLFGATQALGEQIRVKHMPCVVLGILTPKGQSSTGQDQDDVIVMPWTTLVRRLNGTQSNAVGQIMVEARGPEQIATAQQQIAKLLRQRHHLLEDAADDFDIRNLTDTQKAADEQSRTLTMLLGSVALVSLLVGALGIANVMLVSVTERTREIGVRMAVGARGRDVLVQFLVEATLLALGGGGLGILLGIGVAKYVALESQWPTLLSPPAMIAALALAAFAGVTSGLYPALRAARLDPINALKFE
jgi:putative ABC transport system permease protein